MAIMMILDMVGVFDNLAVKLRLVLTAAMPSISELSRLSCEP